MKDLIDSELVKYGYSIIADSSSVILCKENCVEISGDLQTELQADSQPYIEDFSFLIQNNTVSFYLGDQYLLTLDAKEFELISKHIQTLNSNKG